MDDISRRKSHTDQDLTNLLKSALKNLGVSCTLLKQFPEFGPYQDRIRGVVLYGSFARGDSTPSSDIDLLILADSSIKPLSAGVTNVSFYTRQDLLEAQGTIFGGHLARDAVRLYDPENEFRHLLSLIGEIDAEHGLCRIRNMTQILTSPDRDLPKYLGGLVRQGRYLLRSALYALAIIEGNPCYSVREIAKRTRKSYLTKLLTSRLESPGTQDDFELLIEELQGIFGPLPRNRHGSLEATIVNEWGTGSDLGQIALLTISQNVNESDYSAVKKILL